MKKNVASQAVGAQMVNASTGAAFTGSVTVSVTGDAGTQATGSVGSGACTHEGNGYHTYAPAQAETNYDLVAFTFTGSGAIPVTVQIYTTFPQTGDSFARIGSPAGASVSADVAAVKAETASILTDTAEIGAAGAGLTEAGGTGDQLTALATAAALSTVDGNVDSILTDTGTTLPATLATIAGYLDTEIAAILEDTGTTIPGLIAALNDLSAADVNAEVLDVLSTDTFAEPTGVPSATATLAAKLGVLYMMARNRVDVTASKKTFYDDAGNPEFEKDLSDDGTTYSESEANAI